MNFSVDDKFLDRLSGAQTGRHASIVVDQIPSIAKMWPDRGLSKLDCRVYVAIDMSQSKFELLSINTIHGLLKRAALTEKSFSRSVPVGLSEGLPVSNHSGTLTEFTDRPRAEP